MYIYVVIVRYIHENFSLQWITMKYSLHGTRIMTRHEIFVYNLVVMEYYYYYYYYRVVGIKLQLDIHRVGTNLAMP